MNADEAGGVVERATVRPEGVLPADCWGEGEFKLIREMQSYSLMEVSQQFCQPERETSRPAEKNITFPSCLNLI